MLIDGNASSINPITEFHSSILKIWICDWENEPDSYWRKRRRGLEREFHRAARGCAYVVREEDRIEGVFSDLTALKAIRIRSFRSDTQALHGDLS